MNFNFVLLHNNASFHKTSSKFDVLFENIVKILDFPAKSPVLNATENLWGILVHTVYDNRNKFVPIIELKADSFADESRLSSAKPLVSTFQKRLLEVISVKKKYRKLM